MTASFILIYSFVVPEALAARRVRGPVVIKTVETTDSRQRRSGMTKGEEYSGMTLRSVRPGMTTLF